MAGKMRRKSAKRRQRRLPSSLSMDGDVSENKAHSSTEIVDGFWSEQATHPLLIEVILDTLFAYVKPNDLKTCRLVCTKWHVVSLPVIRATFEVTVLGDETPWTISPRTPRLTDFMKLFESNTLGLPFEKFVLGSFDPTVGMGKKFLQIFGATAKKFDFWMFEEIRAVEDIEVFLKSAPMLESLRLPFSLSSKLGIQGDKLKLFSDDEVLNLKNLRTICLGNGRPAKQKLICLPFYEEILSAAENISALFTYDYKPGVMGSVEVLNILENLGRKSSLETLSFFSVNEKHLEVLKKLFVNGVRLKHLDISLSQPPDNLYCFELIEMMRESLISIHFVNFGSLPLKFCPMPKLRLLHLETIPNRNVQQHNTQIVLEDLSNNFPELEYLSLGISVDQFSIGIECPKIKSLRLTMDNMDGDSFERIVKVCPNLTELEVIITADGPRILQLIWTQLQCLQRLSIYGKLSGLNSLDSLFTGILDKGKRTVITGRLTRLKNMTSEVRAQAILDLIDEYQTLPTIGNLTDLRQLTLDVTSTRGRQSHLTDMAAYLGLYSLKKLRSLNVSMCKFSKACSQILVEDLGLESWVIKRDGNIDVISPEWKRQKQRDFPSSKFSFNYTI